MNSKDASLHAFANATDLFVEAAADERKSINASGKASKNVEKTRNRTKTNDKTKQKKATAVPPPEQSNAQPKSKATIPAPPQPEILKAVASLYADRLRPFGRILRKRLAERSEQGEASAECDLTQLKKACEECRKLALTSEEGGEWSALLVGEPDDFVDVYDKCDPYPDALWSAADSYFRSLPETEAVLPGGRYACAQTLASHNLDFLQGYTLGHICHFVQLAIATRKILGYLNGGITSYNLSHSCAKDKAAAEQSSCAQTASVSELEIATWTTARKCLRIIMKDALKSQANQVPLSNIKRIFRSQFEIELSETSLGHSKLSELLQDERLHDICTVRLLDQGYFVIPMFEISDNQSDGQGTESTAFSWADVDDEVLTDDDANANVAEAFCETPCWPDDVCTAQQCGSELSLSIDTEPLMECPSTGWFALSPRVDLVHNTFIHTPATPLASAPRPRSRSLPRCVGRTSLESPSLNLASPELMPPTPEMCTLRTPETWALTTASCTFEYGLQSVPESQAVDTQFSWNATGNVVVNEIAPEFAGFIEHPYLQEEVAFIVENTFISAMPVPPPPSSALRSRSVPKSLSGAGAQERPKFGCVLDEVDDDEKDLIPHSLASPSPCWSLEPPLLEQLSSVVQISLADHV
jgi:hypothetical protein